MDRSIEKISFNINSVDLGKIDYLVENGFYSNRTEFLRAAILHELDHNKNWLEKQFIGKQIDLGLISINSETLKKYTSPCDLIVIGKLNIEEEISLNEMRKKIRSLKVFGKVMAKKDILLFYGLIGKKQ